MDDSLIESMLPVELIMTCLDLVTPALKDSTWRREETVQRQAGIIAIRGINRRWRSWYQQATEYYVTNVKMFNGLVQALQSDTDRGLRARYLDIYRIDHIEAMQLTKLLSLVPNLESLVLPPAGSHPDLLHAMRLLIGIKRIEFFLFRTDDSQIARLINAYPQLEEITFSGNLASTIEEIPAFPSVKLIEWDVLVTHGTGEDRLLGKLVISSANTLSSLTFSSSSLTPIFISTLLSSPPLRLQTLNIQGESRSVFLDKLLATLLELRSLAMSVGNLKKLRSLVLLPSLRRLTLDYIDDRSLRMLSNCLEEMNLSALTLVAIEMDYLDHPISQQVVDLGITVAWTGDVVEGREDSNE